jgi:hypothetical protein
MKVSKILTTIIAAAITAFSFSVLVAPTTSAAVDICNDTSVPPEVKAAQGCAGETSAKDDVKTIVTNILNGIIGASTLVAVIYTVIGGINYITSQGNAAKVQKAKETILYSLIGLVVCALSFAIVNWVIINAINSNNTPANNTTSSPLERNRNTPSTQTESVTPAG